MIKCYSFGKFLKQGFFTFFISCFILLGGAFVYGTEKWQMVGLDYSNSVIDSNYEITFLSKGTVLTRLLGVSKSVLAVNGNNIFWFAPNGLPYMSIVGSRYNIQGYFKKYDVCSLASSGGNYVRPDNCSSIENIDYDVLKSFFSSITEGDILYYNYSNGSDNQGRWSTNFRVCFSSESIGRSICFYDGCDYNGTDSCGHNFSGSMNLENLTFSSLSNTHIGYFPGQNGYLGQFNGSTDGSTQGTINNQVTGDYVYGTCTYKEILVLLETEGYNDYICYGGLDNFSLYDSSVNYNPIPGSGLSILQIWGNSSARAWDTFTDWFIFWNGLYKDTSNNYTAMWESYPAVYRTYFQLYNQYKGGTLDSRTILEYCNLKLSNIDLNNSAGGYFAPFCKTVVYEKQAGIRQSRLDGTIYSDGVYTGDVPISVNWGGVGNMSGLEIQSDGLTFIQDYFNILKAKLSTNYSDGFRGIIPGYILIFLFAIILFKFLSK